jgi:hypothetical protein
MEDSTNSTDLTGYISDLSSLGTTAGGILGALKGKPAAAASKPAAATTSSWTAYLPWIIGGGVVLLIVAVVLGRH